jgi:HAD superfamily hydrolase (TIGR01549 family)
MAARTHDAWLFDLDGTLYAQRWVRLAMACELLLFGWGALGTLRRFRREHEALRREFAAGKELDAAQPSPYRAQLERTATALGRTQTEVEAEVVDWMQQRPGKWLRRFARRKLLAELYAFRADGGRTALVSDYPAEHKLAALDVRSLFEVVVANGEQNGPRRLKPHPEGFLRAAEQLGVAPERCLVIGDRSDADGEAARAARMSFRLIR